jgi:hypothetical protein
MGTLGKAFGTFGAFVAGSEDLIETLIQRARSYIYTTAPPPALAEATRASLAIARREDWRRERLGPGRPLPRRRRRARAAAAGLADPDPAPAGRQRRAGAGLERAPGAAGILVSAIRPPTVPEGSARLRITLSPPTPRATWTGCWRRSPALPREGPREARQSRPPASGPDLVLLHGWGMNAGVWEGCPPPSPRAAGDPIDLPGHGASPFDRSLGRPLGWAAGLPGRGPGPGGLARLVAGGADRPAGGPARAGAGPRPWCCSPPPPASCRPRTGPRRWCRGPRAVPRHPARRPRAHPGALPGPAGARQRGRARDPALLRAELAERPAPNADGPGPGARSAARGGPEGTRWRSSPAPASGSSASATPWSPPPCWRRSRRGCPGAQIRRDPGSGPRALPVAPGANGGG